MPDVKQPIPPSHTALDQKRAQVADARAKLLEAEKDGKQSMKAWDAREVLIQTEGEFNTMVLALPHDEQKRYLDRIKMMEKGR